jgi:hypothetical protein
LLETKGAGSAQGFGLSLGGEEAVYIEDVFSTYLIKPTTANTTYSVINGIDVSGEGGMVWMKSRDAAGNNLLYDTARGASAGANNALISNSSAAQQTANFDYITGLSNGFAVNFATGGGQLTNDGINYVSWAFRKQPKFFDVVTYTGNGSNRTIAHDLGSVPGCIIVKKTSGADNWFVQHRSLGATKYIALNDADIAYTNSQIWNNTEPTSTVFSLGTNSGVNQSGSTYVAYIFAHDAGGFGLTGTDNVISCGSYTGNGVNPGPIVTLGYEPQWLLVKNATDAGNDWYLIDILRGWTADGVVSFLEPNTSDSEAAGIGSFFAVNSTGFRVIGNSSIINGNGSTYIYIAIRRGPMEVPTSGTSVFTPSFGLSASNSDFVNAGFPIDLNWRGRTTGDNVILQDRLRGIGGLLFSNLTDAESTSSAYVFRTQNGITFTSTASFTSWINWSFRRAPGFFDEVCYTGNDTARTLTHNLAAVPELMIVKSRSGTANWSVYVAATTATNVMRLNNANASFGASGYWNNTAPTASVFTIGNNGDVNSTGTTYVAYLFATCAGVSKVGSYTGTGTTLQINCGFTGGARFVMIKRTDSTGDWYVWDSARGIVAGNDPYLLLNSTAAEVTNTDYVDTYSAGFEISSTAPAAINASGGSFIFLAIA